MRKDFVKTVAFILVGIVFVIGLLMTMDDNIVIKIVGFIIETVDVILVMNGPSHLKKEAR